MPRAAPIPFHAAGERYDGAWCLAKVGVVVRSGAVGLAFALALLRGTTVSGDEIARNILLGFVVSAIAVITARALANR